MSTNSAPLIVHTDWSRSWGGQEIRTLTELREMKKRGFRVAMIVREDSELGHRGQQEGIPVHIINFSSLFNPGAWLDLYKLIRRLKPTVVNTHSSKDSWMAGCLSQLCRVPLVIKTRHVLSPISSPFSYNTFFDIIFVCSESIGKQLVREKIDPSKIITQPTGIDEERFKYSENDRQEIRKRYQISDQDILVGNVAFLRVYKGHDFIVRTAATMPENYKFMIVGGGDGHSILLEEIARAGVEDKFILTGHKEDPEHYFSAMDIIFFSSYKTEGVAQSFTQGLLYGIPLLTCTPPSIAEALETVTIYRGIDYNDVEAARQGLLDLSNYLERDEERASSQRQAVAGKYGLTTMIENIVRVYRDHGVIAPAVSDF